jgi:hypothetical protein
MEKNELAPKSAITIQLVITLLIANAGLTITSSHTFSNPALQVCQSSGPSFDLTFMPGFADLVPSNEPVTLSLELRVGVIDPDGVSTVIGSYKNNSSSEWNNVSMIQDTTTSAPDDYVAQPLNYTMNEPSFIVIWDIKFYANDSLNNWNMSSVCQLSVCRQGSTNDDITIQVLVPIAFTTAIVVLILPTIYLLIRRRSPM